MKVVGVIVFNSEETHKENGYTDVISNVPELEYNIKGTNKWYCKESKEYLTVYPHLLKKRYTLSESKEKFPELFLGEL